MIFSEDKYIICIKEKLNKYVNEYERNTGKKLGAIHKDLLNQGYTFTYNTVKYTLDISKTNLNTLVIIALCEYLNININEIFSKNNVFNNTSLQIQNKENFVPLTDKNYSGTYYCYFFKPIRIEDSLDKATLTINIDYDSSNAKFELNLIRKDITGKQIPIKKVLTGTPYLSKKFNNILIFLTSEAGDYYFLTINYTYFTNLDMYFRIGALCSYHSLEENHPLFEKIVICKKEFSPKNETFIHGLLNLNNSKIIIKNKHFKDLCEANELINNFFNSFKNILDLQLSKDYFFSEKQILEFWELNSDEIDMSKEDIIKSLLILRKYSLFPDRIIVSDLDEIPHIIKKF